MRAPKDARAIRLRYESCVLALELVAWQQLEGIA